MTLYTADEARTRAATFAQSRDWSLRQLRGAVRHALRAVATTDAEMRNARASVARRWEAAWLMRAANLRMQAERWRPLP